MGNPSDPGPPKVDAPKGALAPDIWLIYLAIGVLLSVAYPLLPESMRTIDWVIVGLATPIAIFIGIKLNKPKPSGPLWIGLAAVCTFVIAEFWRQSIADAAGTGDVAADAIATLGYVLQIVFLVWILHARGGRKASAIAGDSLIICLAAWMLAWTQLVQPTIELANNSPADQLVGSFYQPLDVVIFYLGFRIFLADSLRLMATRLLFVGLSLAFIGDFFYALDAAGHLAVDLTRIDAIYLASFPFFGALALHPSVRRLGEPVPVKPAQALSTRVVLVGAALLIPVIVLSVATGPTYDRVVMSLSAIALCLAVVARMATAIREHAHAQDELVQRALHDPLTGLPNRSFISNYITNYLRSPGALCSVLSIDLDGLKPINDTLGYEIGDEVIVTIAQRIEDSVQPAGLVARSSGDEFVVVLAGVHSESLLFAMADRILETFDSPVQLPVGDVFIDAAVGIATSDQEEGIGAELLLRNAATAMERAKQIDRNGAALFDPSIRETLARRLAIETSLRGALDRKEMRMFHQPIVRMDTEAVVGFEALIRWSEPEKGLVSPVEFVPIAEDTGLIVEIGAWAIVEGTRQLGSWITDGKCDPRTSVSVNVSPRQLRDESIVGVVERALEAPGLVPQNVWLEVTETAMIADPDIAHSALTRLRRLGVRIALDDFGTGYSALATLKRYPIDRLKVDRSFVMAIEHDPDDRNLVKSIVAMARSLDMDVVAEGVETRGQCDILRDLGVTYGQGYYFGKPAPWYELEDEVLANQPPIEAPKGPASEGSGSGDVILNPVD